MASAFQFGNKKPNFWAYLKQLVNQIAASMILTTTGAGVPVIYRFSCVNLTGSIDIVVPEKIRVIDFWAVGSAAAGAGDTVQVLNSASAISNALDMNVADTTVVRAGTLNDANWQISAGGTLRVTGASAVNCDAYVSAIVIP